MDKKLSRQILFRPGKPINHVIEEKANIQPNNINTKPMPEIEKMGGTTNPTLTPQERSKKIYEWLVAHPLINLNGLCKKASVNRSNFVKGVAANWELKTDVIVKLVSELKKYGYAE